MPGHIYAQSDKIQEAISAFSAAAANELKWIESDSLYPNGHHGHNVHFLIHALNLGGRYRRLDEVGAASLHVQGEPARARRQQPARRLAAGLLRPDQVDRCASRSGTRSSTARRCRSTTSRSSRRGGTGRSGWPTSATGQADKAKATLADMQKDLDAVTSAKEPIGIGAAGARGDDRGARRRQQEGLRAVPQGGRLAKRRCSTPSRRRIRVRSSKGWANVALALGDYATAEKAYRETLEREPGSGRAYFGLAAALDGLGKSTEARERADARGEGVGAAPTATCRRCRRCSTSTAAAQE